jgi:Immunity protein 53
MLTVQLADTSLQDIPFETRVAKRSDVDWIHCAVADMQFRGSGGAQNLAEILNVFLEWAEQHRLGDT